MDTALAKGLCAWPLQANISGAFWNLARTWQEPGGLGGDLGRLGGVWSPLKDVLGGLECNLGHLGGCWTRLGGVLGRLGGVLGGLGGDLAHFGGV